MGYRRWLPLFLALWLCAAPALAAEYWQDVPEGGVVCRESRPGCHLLQMVMTGSFAQMPLGDSISTRVFSAVLPQLCALEEGDFAHFIAQFGVEETTIRQAYYIALGNCLLADIDLGTVQTPEAAAARRVLLLFLNPSGEDNADAQKAAIRGALSEEILESMADSTGLPLGFIRYLMETENWQTMGGDDGAAQPGEEP